MDTITFTDRQKIEEIKEIYSKYIRTPLMNFVFSGNISEYNMFIADEIFSNLWHMLNNNYNSEDFFNNYRSLYGRNGITIYLCCSPESFKMFIWHLMNKNNISENEVKYNSNKTSVGINFYKITYLLLPNIKFVLNDTGDISRYNSTPIHYDIRYHLNDGKITISPLQLQLIKDKVLWIRKDQWIRNYIIDACIRESYTVKEERKQDIKEELLGYGVIGNIYSPPVNSNQLYPRIWGQP